MPIKARSVNLKLPVHEVPGLRLQGDHVLIQRHDLRLFAAAIFDFVLWNHLAVSGVQIDFTVIINEDKINADLIDRRKQAALANGEQWIDPDELAKREMEEAEKQREEDRIRDLKEHCIKKGLSFETENQKYLAKEAAKKARMKVRLSPKQK